MFMKYRRISVSHTNDLFSVHIVEKHKHPILHTPHIIYIQIPCEGLASKISMPIKVLFHVYIFFYKMVL